MYRPCMTTSILVDNGGLYNVWVLIFMHIYNITDITLFLMDNRCPTDTSSDPSRCHPSTTPCFPSGGVVQPHHFLWPGDDFTTERHQWISIKWTIGSHAYYHEIWGLPFLFSIFFPSNQFWESWTKELPLPNFMFQTFAGFDESFQGVTPSTGNGSPCREVHSCHRKPSQCDTAEGRYIESHGDASWR